MKCNDGGGFAPRLRHPRLRLRRRLCPVCATAPPSFAFSSSTSFAPLRPRSCPHMGCVGLVWWGLSPSPWWTNGASCIIVIVVGVVFDRLGLPVGPVGAGGGATVMGWGGLLGFALLSSCLFSSSFLSLLPPTITSLLTTTSSLVLCYPHMWCETVIGLFLVAVQGISNVVVVGRM